MKFKQTFYYDGITEDVYLKELMHKSIFEVNEYLIIICILKLCSGTKICDTICSNIQKQHENGQGN